MVPKASLKNETTCERTLPFIIRLCRLIFLKQSQARFYTNSIENASRKREDKMLHLAWQWLQLVFDF